VKEHYDKMIDLGISPEKIAKNANLLGMKSETVKEHYDKMIDLGISPEKIAKNANLLGMKSETVKEHYDKMIDLGISPEKIAMNARLLGRNPETIQNNFDKLKRLGLSSEKIISQISLLTRNPDVIQYNYDHLSNVINLDQKIISNQPQLLLFNPDTFAKKLRIIKLDILGLKRRNLFKANKYIKLYIASPSTLLAKKNYCIKHSINFINNLLLISRPWGRIIKKVEKTISSAEAGKIGRALTRSYKQRYDIWMGEYKKWCFEFYPRRGRRLIVRV